MMMSSSACQIVVVLLNINWSRLTAEHLFITQAAAHNTIYQNKRCKPTGYLQNQVVDQNALSFVMVALPLVMSPGPNGVLIANTVPVSGRRAGYANVAGCILAFYFHGTLSILGISAILLASSHAFFVVKMTGAAYLCWIGLKALREAGDTHCTLDQSCAKRFISTLAQRGHRGSIHWVRFQVGNLSFLASRAIIKIMLMNDDETVFTSDTDFRSMPEIRDDCTFRRYRNSLSARPSMR